MRSLFVSLLSLQIDNCLCDWLDVAARSGFSRYSYSFPACYNSNCSSKWDASSNSSATTSAVTDLDLIDRC